MTNSGTAPPNASSKVFLLIAVALGILATILAFVFIQNGANGDGGPRDHIVVAKHDISPNTPLDPTRDLALRDIPKSFSDLKRGTIDADSLGSWKGQRVNRDIRAGQPVFVGDFSGIGDLQLVDPYFALTIPADTGMIIPGDHVKVIIALPTPLASPAVATTLAAAPPAFDATIIGPKDGFKVLAVGGYLNKTRAQVTTADQYNASTANQKTVTVEVTEAQAKELIGALNGASSTQKATLLICPSDLTRPPTPLPAAPAAAAASPETHP